MDADEVTYPAHIMLRYKIEKDLLSGNLPIEELPLAWDEEIYKSLKIKPKNFAEGCLQDIHWACGAIGYFPTYTLGAMFAAQISNSIEKSIDSKDLIAKGDFKPIIKWLEQNIHAYGSQCTPNEIIINSTGLSLRSDIFKQYLKDKY